MFTRQDIPQLKQDLSIQATSLGHDLTLKTRWGVFSPRAIDDGTLLLMKYLDIDECDKCLDLGCGYGMITNMGFATCFSQLHLALSFTITANLSFTT